MSSLFKGLMVTSGAILLSACATHMNQQQCQSANWYQRGLQTGSAGQMASSLQQESADCKRFGIDVNFKQYHRGWVAGTKLFCTPKNAYQLGVLGKNYAPVCPTNMAKRFASSWRRGLRLFCIPSSGYRLGRSGAPLPTFCASDQFVKFRNAYARGKRQYSSIQSTKDQLRNIDDRISAIDGQIDYLSRHHKHQHMGPGMRFIRLEELSAERSRLQNERSRLNSTLSRAEINAN